MLLPLRVLALLEPFQNTMFLAFLQQVLPLAQYDFVLFLQTALQLFQLGLEQVDSVRIANMFVDSDAVALLFAQRIDQSAAFGDTSFDLQFDRVVLRLGFGKPAPGQVEKPFAVIENGIERKGFHQDLGLVLPVGDAPILFRLTIFILAFAENLAERLDALFHRGGFVKILA